MLSADATASFSPCNGTNNVFGSSAPYQASGFPPVCFVSGSTLICELDRVCRSTSDTKNVAEFILNGEYGLTSEWVLNVECGVSGDFCMIYDNAADTIDTVQIDGTSQEDYIAFAWDPPNPTVGWEYGFGPTQSGVHPVTGNARGRQDHDILVGTIETQFVTINLYGGQGQDHLFGLADRSCNFFGGDDNDFVCAGAGDDYAEGGEDDDLLMGSLGRDTLKGGDGNDVICGHAATGVPSNLLSKFNASYGTGETDDWTTWSWSCDQTSGDNRGVYYGEAGDDFIFTSKTTGTSRLTYLSWADGGSGTDVIKAAVGAEGPHEFCDPGQDGDELDVQGATSASTHQLIITATLSLDAEMRGNGTSTDCTNTSGLSGLSATGCNQVLGHVCPTP